MPSAPRFRRPAGTRILATLGPASLPADPVPMLKRLVQAGADGFRINFSHGDPEEHLRTAALLRDLQTRQPCGPLFLLQDLPGPKLRLGEFAASPMALHRGQIVTLVEGDQVDGEAIPVPIPGLAAALHPKDVLTLDDGNVLLKVREIVEKRMTCVVLAGKSLSSRKGLSPPPFRLPLGALTEKDRRFLALGCCDCFDLTALSFVKDAADLHTARKILATVDPERRLVAKIERTEAIRNLLEIIAASDAIMVARGDLGLEYPPEEVPLLQRQIIRLARLAGKPVIVATQMLESMITNIRPTRAEVSDIAMAVWEGADCVMLSGETAVGAYPVETVETMDRAVRAGERGRVPDFKALDFPRDTSQDAIAAAALDLATAINARCIAVATLSGATALRIARYRHPVPLLAVTPKARTQRFLSLAWGTWPVHLAMPIEAREFPAVAVALASERGLVKPGDRMVLLYGDSLAEAGVMQALQVHQVDAALLKRGREILK